LSQKIIKIVATRCQILRLKCTKFDFGWGSAPDPAGGITPPDPLAGFERPNSKGGKGGKTAGEKRGGERWGKEAFLVMWPRKLSALNSPMVSCKIFV